MYVRLGAVEALGKKGFQYVRLSAVEAQTKQKMYSYYVYILKCSDQSYYTGITNDLDKRIEQHDKEIQFVRTQLQNIDINLQKTTQLIQRAYLQK